MSAEARKAEGFIGADLSRALAREGKLLRPLLVLLSARLGPDSKQDMTTLAASVEMIHLASLIHDDVIDDASKRRGVAALHVRIGRTRAILAGDWLLARALSLAAPYHSGPLISFFCDRIEELCRSEIVQDAQAGRLRTDMQSYLTRIDGKTGSLFRLACRAGGEASGADAELLGILDDWARALGRGFQMDDDVLDYTGRGGDWGKTPMADLRSGLATLPLILAREHEDVRLNRLLKSSGRRPLDLRRRKRIRSEVIRLGGVTAAGEAAQEAYAEVRRLTSLLPEHARPDFLTVVDRLERRGRAASAV